MKLSKEELIAELKVQHAVLLFDLSIADKKEQQRIYEEYLTKFEKTLMENLYG